MSNRLFQGIVNQLKDSVDRVIGIVDENGRVIACSDVAQNDEMHEGTISSILEGKELFTSEGMTYKTYVSDGKGEYAVFSHGTDETALKCCNILMVTVAGIKQYYDEKHDRTNFIKNVILDNILPGDVYIKARELHFNGDVTRVVFLVRLLSPAAVSTFDIVSNMFPDKQRDFVFSISETDLVLVKEIKSNIEPKDLEKLAKSIVDTISGESFTRVAIGIGTRVTGVKELAKSFNEAQVALEVGKVFDTEKTIVRHDNLGIARLIYQLPTTLCEMFLREVFKRGSIDSLDRETLFTIQRFFENNLNVSETSRKLFVHRNTLVYRLEKIKKLTGLDLREFDHAIIFKVALMVKRYLSANPVKY